MKPDGDKTGFDLRWAACFVNENVAVAGLNPYISLNVADLDGAERVDENQRSSDLVTAHLSIVEWTVVHPACQRKRHRQMWW